MQFELRPSDPDAARELARACGVGPTTAQVLLHRGLSDEASARDFLAPKLSQLTIPDGMADRAIAADRIARAIRAGETIAVFGDYDVDGTTSAAILADILEALGGSVTALVANRFDGGYGFSDRALDRCLDTGAGLIVTCDCGSSDHERIREASRRGIDVVVVDHHLVPDEPLGALAFLNPHRPDCGFPYKGLASAGLALSVGAAVRQELGASLDVRPWLDLVALGTIADLAPLDGDNRRLVRAGLRLLGNGGGRPGVAALREVAKVAAGPVGSVDVAFRLAPRLNAAGRLGDPTVTLELLRSRSPEQARGLAARIEQLNQERKDIEREVTAAARAQVGDVFGGQPEGGAVVAAEGWHRGVVGISAARLVDALNVPVAVVALDGAVGHGSVRAPEGFPVYDAVARCRAHLEAFGGHQGAAGLTLRADRVEAFRAAFADACRDLGAPGGGARYTADVRLDGSVYTVPRAQELLGLEPLGEPNAEPLFAIGGARVEQAATVGQDDAHLKLRLRLGRQTLWAFGYELGSRAATLPETLDCLGHVRRDTYRGGDHVELRLVAL